MSDSGGSVSYSYDPLNRLTSISRGSRTFSYAYDNASNITSRTYPDQTTTSYTYDDDERLASATFNTNTIGYSYDAAGNPIQMTRPPGNGWTETRAYDAAGRLTEIKDANATSTLQKLDYTYDPAGNATSLTRAAGASEYYQYDNRERLTEVCYSNPCASATDTIAWTYDPVGNRLTETRPAGTTTYTYDAGDELTATAGPSGNTAYTYDGDGNQTSAGTTTYTYDLADRLTGATVNATTTTYSYDGDGNRLTATTGTATTNYEWDTNNPLPQLATETDGSGATLRDYIQGLDTIAMLEAGNTYYYHHDRLGSTTTLTSSNGTTEWAYTYEPFGTPKTTTQADPNTPTNPLQYIGQYQDPNTGLYDLRARQYDPTTGLFTSTDPTPPAPTNPYQAPYDYAGQDPINNYDLDGMCVRGFGWACKAATTVKSAAKATEKFVAKHKAQIAEGVAAAVVIAVAPEVAPVIADAILSTRVGAAAYVAAVGASRVVASADKAEKALAPPGSSSTQTWAARGVGALQAAFGNAAPPSFMQIRGFLKQPVRGSGSWPGFLP